MPFTFAHPAIVLPLHALQRRCFSLTALVAGSLSPDFEYFLRMQIHSSHIHTLWGLLYFDLPLGLILAFLFHNIVRDPLLDNLPGFLRRRVSVYKTFRWNHYFRTHVFVVLYSLLIGAASHLFWDAFTHSDGFFVKQCSFLKGSIYVAGIHIGYWKILQHGSTLMGFAVLFFALYRLPSRRESSVPASSAYRVCVLFMTTVFMLLRHVIVQPLYRQYGHTLVAFISCVLLSLLCAGMLFRIRQFCKQRSI